MHRLQGNRQHKHGFDTRTTFRRLRARATPAAAQQFRRRYFGRQVRRADRRQPLTWASVPEERPAHPVLSRRSRRRRPLAPPPAPPVPTRLGHGQEWQGSGQDGEIVETIPRVCHWQSNTAHVGQLNTAHVGDRHLGLSGRSPVDALRRCGAGGHDAPFHKIPISHAGTVHRRPGRRDKAVPPRTIARDAVARPPRLLCRPARRVSPPRPRGLALSWRGSTGRLDAVPTAPPPVAPTSAAWRAAVRRAPDPRPARPGAGPAQARRRGGGPR